MTRADTAVVVLNWNNAVDTLECLASLRDSDAQVDVIVVDNASADGSVEEVENSGLATTVIRNVENLGYAGGNNVGLREGLRAGYEYIVVLNNDTLVASSAIGALIRHVRDSPQPLAVSPVITYADEPTAIWFAGGVVDNGWPRHLQAREVEAKPGVLRPTEIVTGCCIATSRQVWSDVGEFDAGFFLIFEDSDWSVRATARGVALAVATDCAISHKVSRSFRIGPMPYLGTFYFVRNGLVFDWRHARRCVPRFLVSWVLRPTARRFRRQDTESQVAFAWLGLAAAILRMKGGAPDVVSRYARSRQRRGARQLARSG